MTPYAPPPRILPPSEPAVIQYVRFSQNHVRRNRWWSGRIVTSTNVASLVLRLPFFSFEIPRRSFGEFEFRTFVQDVPPLYRQWLHGELTAYTPSGRATSIPLDLDFQ